VRVIPDLKLIHIIPKERIQLNYLKKIAGGHAFSHFILERLWEYKPDYPENKVLKKLRYWNELRKISGFTREIFVAEYLAKDKARIFWNNQ
jgi:hypothetical protein